MGGDDTITYTVTSNPDGLTGTGAASPIMVNGLSNGTPYSFTVVASNSAGPGPASVASNSVQPAVVANLVLTPAGGALADAMAEEGYCETITR